MSEKRPSYEVLNPCVNHVTLDTLSTDLYTVRAELEEIERRLIPLLVTVQRALGKEPSVNTRAERRRA